MKKAFLILIALLLLATVFVCSCNPPVESDTDTETNADTETNVDTDSGVVGSDTNKDTDSDSDYYEDPNAFDSGLLGSDWTGPQI